MNIAWIPAFVIVLLNESNLQQTLVGLLIKSDEGSLRQFWIMEIDPL